MHQLNRPALMYLFFGRRAILPSTTMWQSIVYPPIFTAVISNSLRFLFEWTSFPAIYLFLLPPRPKLTHKFLA